MKNKNTVNGNPGRQPPKQKVKPEDKDPVEPIDYTAGAIYVFFGALFALFLLWFYWIHHGGSIADFSFWQKDDQKWLEVLFWSFFTAHAWNITDVAFDVSDMKFHRRYLWEYIGHMFEAPAVSLALVIIITNLGLTVGKADISLEQAPPLIVIAFAIISAYFSRETVQALYAVSKWLSSQVQSKIKTSESKTETNTDKETAEALDALSQALIENVENKSGTVKNKAKITLDKKTIEALDKLFQTLMKRAKDKLAEEKTESEEDTGKQQV